MREAVEREERRLAEKVQVTADKIVAEYARLAFVRASDVMEWKNGPLTVKPSAELGEHVLAAIAEIVETKDGLRIKLHDKKGALDSLARHLGMFTDNMRLSGPDNEPLIPLEFARKLLAEYDSRRGRG